MKTQLLNTFISLVTILGGLKRTEGRTDILDIYLNVPTWAKAGSTVSMSCTYDVGGAPVYQVKWYKGSKEFYRYTPKESPSVKIFLFPGLQVDSARSNATLVTLKKLDLSMKGTYSCEVSTDAPEFLTDIKSAYLDVVALPESDPVINPLKPSYSFGDVVEANCTSYRSRPPANLTWSINNKQVKPEYLVPPRGFGPRIKGNGTESSQLSLRFHLRPDDFQEGKVTLTCTARIHGYYHRSSEVNITVTDKPKLSSVVDNSSSSGSSGNSRAKNSGSTSHGFSDLSRRYFKGLIVSIFIAIMPRNFLMPIILVS